MIGARDMAFPKLNMFSYWFMPPAMVFITYSFFVEGGLGGGRLDELSILYGRQMVDAGFVERPDILVAGALVCRDLVALGFDQLHHDHRDAAGSGDEDVPDADDSLGDVHHGDFAGVRACRF